MIDCREISYPNLHFEVRRERLLYTITMHEMQIIIFPKSLLSRMFVCAAGHVVVCVTAWAVAAVAAADDSCDFTIPCPTCPNLSRTPAQCGAAGASTANITLGQYSEQVHLTSPHLTSPSSPPPSGHAPTLSGGFYTQLKASVPGSIVSIVTPPGKNYVCRSRYL